MVSRAHGVGTWRRGLWSQKIIRDRMKWHHPGRTGERASLNGIFSRIFLVHRLWWYVEYVYKIHFFFCHSNRDLEQTVPWESAPCLRQKERRGKSREKQNPLYNPVTKLSPAWWAHHPGPKLWKTLRPLRRNDPLQFSNTSQVYWKAGLTEHWQSLWWG